MYYDSDRRVFVRNLMVGLPALAGGLALPAAVHARPVTSPSSLPNLPDEFDRELRKLAGRYNAGLSTLASPADAVTPHLRALAIYRQQSPRDAELASAMRGLVAEHGRERFLREPDFAPLRRGLEYYGLPAAALVVAPAPIDVRSQALDALTRHGAETMFFDAWSIVSILGEYVSVPNFCELVQDLVNVLEAMAGIMCIAGAFLPIFAPECFASSVVLAILKFFNYVGC